MFFCTFWRLLCLFAAILVLSPFAPAEDGYRLWLRYDRIEDDSLRASYAAVLRKVTLATHDGQETATITAAREELRAGIAGLVGIEPTIEFTGWEANTRLGLDGFSLTATAADGVSLGAPRDIGILYGVFDLLRRVQARESTDNLRIASEPRIQRRLLNHWDDLNRFVERGYAGQSLWEWFYLPGRRSPRYRDYARACASIGINGAVINNVNANALILTPHYLEKVAALAEELRPYGVRVYLTARFSAPIEIGGLKTADPLDSGVVAWWREKVAEIYTFIPDLGGFLVKANSESQPGPQDYKRNHADGANMLADALAPHGGIVMWRAFVYQPENTEDRVKQASSEFVPLDGKFRDNVVVQIKNGPLDFMPREPFSPLFGQLRQTNMAIELQITQEYLGHSTQLAYLAPLWKEVLDADTFAHGVGSTVGRVLDGTLPTGSRLTVFAGVANTGTDRNWTGHPLAQANWYAYGRLAWDHALTADQIAEEWIRLTFGADAVVLEKLKPMLLGSRETVVNYSMPLGLHHIMERGHHYGPGPWVSEGRADWTSPYYHQADAQGLGANRGATGSNALENYAPELAARWGSLETCPENLLLWFHHLPWDHRMKSGRILWDELCLRYQQGVDEVRAMQRTWTELLGRIDDERHGHVAELLRRQERDAREWRDACLLYFQTFSRRPLPEGVEPPAHSLEYYESINLRFVPGHPGDQ